MKRRRSIAAAASLAVTAMLGACTVYQTAPGVYSTAPQASFDRSWNAARSAFEDQGVAISSADRAAGIIRGRRGSIDLTATVRTQADGSVRVEFNTSGATAEDPQLIDRVSRSYDARMGR